MTRIVIGSYRPESRDDQAAIATRLLPSGLGRGRAAGIRLPGRFDSRRHRGLDDGSTREAAPSPSANEATFERPKRVIVRDASPNIVFDRAIDPYRGCEQGCFYCFARPGHVHMGRPAGIAFEDGPAVNHGAAERLERELGAAGYWPAPIALGANADPYQPFERRHRITRSLLEVLLSARHPVSIVTKSDLILRDLDILSAMGRNRLVKVFVSAPTLDREVARAMEPQAPTPAKRLETIEALNDAGVPAGILIAPILPAINDAEIDPILTRAYMAGAREARYAVLRPPPELRGAFRERLLAHYPDRLRRTVSLIQAMVDDEDRYARLDGPGSDSPPYAWMIRRRFETAARRLGYRETPAALRSDLFRKPAPAGAPVFAGYGGAETREYLGGRTANS